VFQDGLDDLPVFDESDELHDSPTLRTSQGIDLVDLLGQPGSGLPVFFRTFIGFQDAGDPVALDFFPFSPADVPVISIIPYRLFPLSGMWGHMAASHSRASKTFSSVPSFA
jgi:hypothetical protein